MHTTTKQFARMHRRRRMMHACIVSAALLGAPFPQSFAADPYSHGKNWDDLAQVSGVVRAMGIKSTRVAPPMIVKNHHIQQLPPVDGLPTVDKEQSSIIPVGYSEPVTVAQESQLGAPARDRIVLRVAPTQIQFDTVTDPDKNVSEDPDSSPTIHRVSVRLTDSKARSEVLDTRLPESIVKSDLAPVDSEWNPWNARTNESPIPNAILIRQTDVGKSDAASGPIQVVKIKPTVIALASTGNALKSNSPMFPQNGLVVVTNLDIEQNDIPSSATTSSSVGLLEASASPANELPSQSELSAPTPLMTEPVRMAASKPDAIQSSPVTDYVIQNTEIDSQPELRSPSEHPRAMETPVESKIPFPTSTPTSSTLQVMYLSGQIVHVSSPFTQLLVEDERICKVVPTGEREFSVVGSNIGITRIAFWSANGNEAKPTIIQIEVQRPWQTQLVESTDDLKALSDAIAHMHPNSKVELVAAKDGSLVVRGDVESKTAAKQILSLVRKLCLIPVRDQLQISTR